MAIANPVTQNYYGSGVVAPVAVSPKQAKPLVINTIEDALNILNLVNIDGEVLDVASLGKDNLSLIRIASEMVKARKAGSDIRFENGRIMLNKELFAAIISSAENTNTDPSNIGKPKLTGSADNPVVQQKPKEQNSQTLLQQNIPMFAPPPQHLEMKKRRERPDASKASASSPAPEIEDDDNIPMLSSSQAYYILVDIVPPGGGKYILHLKETFEDKDEDRKALETGLEDFWKDFGNNISVNARHTNIVVKPRILLGGFVNSDVSKKLVLVYVSQSTQEKLSSSRLLISEDKITIRPSRGSMTVELTSKKVANYLFGLQTTKMDSGIIAQDDGTDANPLSNFRRSGFGAAAFNRGFKRF